MEVIRQELEIEKKYILITFLLNAIMSFLFVSHREVHVYLTLLSLLVPGAALLLYSYPCSPFTVVYPGLRYVVGGKMQMSRLVTVEYIKRELILY